MRGLSFLWRDDACRQTSVCGRRVAAVTIVIGIAVAAPVVDPDSGAGRARQSDQGAALRAGISDYEPLLRKRRARLEELRTGDGRPLPKQLKAQIGSELDRLELTLEQIKSVETERDAMLSLSDEGTPAPGAMLKSLKGIGPEFAGVLWSEGLFRSFSNRRQVASYATAHSVLFRHAFTYNDRWYSLNWLRHIRAALVTARRPHQEESSYEPALPPRSIFLRQLCANLV